MVFGWAMQRAIAAADVDSKDAFAGTVILLFEACAKVCKLGRTNELNMFFSAFDGIPTLSAKSLIENVSKAATRPELQNAISRGYSEAQQYRTSTKDGIFGSPGH